VKFTVCVPTLNAATNWSSFSSALRSQTAKPHEVIIIDSESEDGTAEFAKRDGFRVISIARRDFRHGATRQFAAELAADSDIIVYLTQDAILTSPDSLAILLCTFENPEVVAAYGRQLPRKGADPIESHARTFNYPPWSRVRSAKSVESLGFRTIFFSNSFGAYRRSALMEVGGFPTDASFGEDTLVAARLISNGWQIAYVAEAQVFHSHSHTWLQEFQRYKSVGVLHATNQWVLRDFGGASGEGLRFVKSELALLSKSAPYLIPSAIIRNFCKYLGYKVGMLERTLSDR